MPRFCTSISFLHYLVEFLSDWAPAGAQKEKRTVRDLFCGAEELRARNRFGSELVGFSAVSHRSASLRRASESGVILISIQVAVSQ